MLFSFILNLYVLLTCGIVFHLKSSSCYTPIRLKMNQDLIAWRDMAGRNWITTILSHQGWCTWSTIINGQEIIARKITLFIFLIWQLKQPHHFFSYDSLTIYDGGLSTSPMMGKYCGDSIPPTHISSSIEILINFQSDSSGPSYTGFQLEYNPIGKQSRSIEDL